MGLQTTNYEVKSLGIELPTAYAIVSKLNVDGENGLAEFHIQTSREAALTKEPIEKVNVAFTVERDKNPLEQAYIASKATKTVRKWVNNELRYVEVAGVFADWEDDIVEVEEIEYGELEEEGETPEISEGENE